MYILISQKKNSMTSTPLISILTSSYNRKNYLLDLLNSLKNQNFKNFEWIIGDDGSSDNSYEMILSNKDNISFDIKYIKSSHRIGKAKMDNIILQNMRGKYLIYCGSDDYFLPNAFETLVKLIQENTDYDFGGVIAQCVDENNKSITFDPNFIPNEKILVEFNELKKYLIGDDAMIEFCKNFKEQKYLEVDFVINESSLYKKIYSNKKFMITSKIVKVMRRSKDSISFEKKLKYTRGSAYCISETINMDEYNKFNLINKLKIVINYWRYCIHGDLNILYAKNLWEVVRNKNFLLFYYLISLFFVFRDNFQKKVEKTHIEFNKNINLFKITKIDI